MSWLSNRRRALQVVLLSLVLVVAAAAGIVLWNTTHGTPAPGTTVVSLTFDDSTQDQKQAQEILDRNGLKGTFYTVSGLVDTPGYLTRADLLQLEEDGHEVGGHTVLHTDLTQLDPPEARREICIDRKNLQDWGLHPTSFAYPYGSQEQASLAALARDCGYSSARNLSNLRSFKGCERCAPAESLPPADPFQIRTPAGVDPSWTLENLKAQVTDAQRAGGGWVPLVFHRICDNCSTISVSPQILEVFAGWLKDNAAAFEVRTVSEVVRGSDGSVPDVTFGVPAESPPNQAFAPGPPSAPSGVPACWTLARNGQNDAAVSVQPGADGQRAAMTLTVTNFVDGDAKVLPTMDLGSCAAAAEPGATYTLGARYRSTPTATPQFVLYTRGPTGHWSYWTSGPFMDASAGWRAAQWTTPPTPPGTTGLSWGLGLTSNGSVSVVQFGLNADAAPVAADTTGAGGDSRSIGLWGVMAGVLLLFGLWWLIGERIRRAVAKWRSPAPPEEPQVSIPPARTPTSARPAPPTEHVLPERAPTGGT